MFRARAFTRTEVDGAIHGGVVVDQVGRSALPGRMALRFVLPVLGVAILVWAALAVLDDLRHTDFHVGALLDALLPLVFMILIFKFVIFGRLGRKPGSSRGERTGLFSRGASALASGTIHSGSRLLGAAVAGGSRAGGSLADAVTEIRRFRVTTATGEMVDCELLGEIRGAALRQGDLVRVRGRVTRRGIVRAQRVQLTSSGASIIPHVPAQYRIALFGTVGALMTLAVVGTALALR